MFTTNHFMHTYTTTYEVHVYIITKQLNDGLFPKKEVIYKLYVYSCLSKPAHYTTWVLPINKESQN